MIMIQWPQNSLTTIHCVTETPIDYLMLVDLPLASSKEKITAAEKTHKAVEKATTEAEEISADKKAK